MHLALDTSGQGGRMGVRAFVSRALGLGGNELAREFLEASLSGRGGFIWKGLPERPLQAAVEPAA